MKNLLILLALVPMLTLVGCAGEGGGSSNLDLPFIGDISTESSGKGRYDAWAAVEGKKVDAIKAVAIAEREEAKAKAAEASSMQIILDTPEKIAAWAAYQNMRILGDAVIALAGGKQNPLAQLQPTPMPKSGFAEGAEVVLGGVARVVESPTGIAGIVGYTVGQAARGAAQGQRVTATDNAQVTINQATASGESSASAGNGAGAGKTESAGTITAEQHNQCTTCAGGRACTIEEINGCFIRDYGHDTEMRDGKIWLGDEQVWPR